MAVCVGAALMYGAALVYGGYAEWVEKVTALRDRLRATRGVDRLNVATSLLNAVGQAASAAPASALRERWLAQYRALRLQVAALRSQFTERPPAAWLRALDVFSDKALNLADDVAKGVGGTVRALPLLLPLTIVAAAYVLGAGGLVKRLRGKR